MKRFVTYHEIIQHDNRSVYKVFVPSKINTNIITSKLK